MRSTLLFAICWLISCVWGKINLKDLWDDANDVWDKGNFWYETYLYCKASGASNCPLMASLCTAYQTFASPVMEKNFMASILSELAVNKYCLGEPTLKCCRKIAEYGCWSAFNQPAPINCEGNPAYGITETAGLCLAPCLEGCAGCLCNYLSRCNSPPRRRNLLSEASSYNTNYWKLGRMASVYSLISVVMNSEALSRNTEIDEYTSSFADIYGLTYESKQEQIIDFIKWRGCKYYDRNSNILTSNIPILDLLNWNSVLIVRDDIFDDIIPIKMALPYFAIVRYAAEIPQFWIKIDFIYSNVWDDEKRSEYLRNNSIDSAEFELLQYIDYGGLLLLKDIFHENWEIMAVPIDNEMYVNFTETTNNTSNDFSKCHANDGRGSAAMIYDFEWTKLDNTNVVNIKFQINDTQQQSELSDNIQTRIFWGDFSEIDVYFSEIEFDLSHSYDDNGEYQIVVQVLNTAGLYTQFRKTIKLENIDGSGNVIVNGYPNIQSVEITLELSAGGNQFGGTGTQMFYFEAASETSFVNESNYDDSEFHTLGLFEWTKDNTSIPMNITLNPYSWNLGTNMQYIRFTCRTFDHYVY
eukprot:141300_1